MMGRIRLTRLILISFFFIAGYSDIDCGNFRKVQRTRIPAKGEGVRGLYFKYV